MSDATPIWFLDIDGVINAVCERFPKGFTDWQVLRSHLGYRITYSPTVIAELNEVDRQGLAHIYWLTTWCEEAQILAKDIGVDEFPLAATKADMVASTSSSWWKLDVVRAWVAQNPGRRFVWTDDDLAFDRDAFEFLAALPAGQALAIAPKTRDGLTFEQLVLIEEFLKA